MKVDISTTEIQSYMVYPDTKEIGGRTPEGEGKGQSLQEGVSGCRRRWGRDERKEGLRGWACLRSCCGPCGYSKR